MLKESYSCRSSKQLQRRHHWRRKTCSVETKKMTKNTWVALGWSGAR